jgi:hypothetical protein
MNAAILWSRILIVLGLVGMLVGAIDPLEGSFVILPSVGLVALGALVGKSRHRGLLFWSMLFVAIGVAVMVVLSWLGGIGGNSGRSIWWGVAILPYPVGWIMGLVGGALALTESWKRHRRHATQ